MAASLLNWLKGILFGRHRAPTGVSPFQPGAGPAKIIILRHAEKTGDKRDPHLSKAGRQRAEKLASYIPETFGAPQFLFAAKTSKRSSRPAETLQPLSAAIGLGIDDRFDDEDFEALAAELAKPAYAGKFTAISWRHSDIPALAAVLGAPSGTFPEPWNEAVYDQIIEIAYRGRAAPAAKQITMPF